MLVVVECNSSLLADEVGAVRRGSVFVPSGFFAGVDGGNNAAAAAAAADVEGDEGPGAGVNEVEGGSGGTGGGTSFGAVASCPCAVVAVDIVETTLVLAFDPSEITFVPLPPANRPSNSISR